MTLEQLTAEALSLPEDTRLLLADKLVASVYPLTDADNEAVVRRRAEYLAGTATPIPSEEVFRQGRELLAADHGADDDLLASAAVRQATLDSFYDDEPSR